MSKRISQLTELTSGQVDPAADYLAIVDSSAGQTKKVKVATLTGNVDFGWAATGESWSYNAWDSTIQQAIITVPTDATVKYSPGMYVRFSQPTGGVKWGIIMAVSATTLTVLMKAGSTFTNETISSPVYSISDTPVGFDKDPAQWTLTLTGTNDDAQVSATVGTWYNLGSKSLALGIGAWKVSYKVSTYIGNTNGGIGFKVTLSTANNTESDTRLSTYWETVGGVSQQVANMLTQPPEDIKLAAKTTYYMNTKSTSGTASAIYNFGARNTTIIKALCAYL